MIKGFYECIGKGGEYECLGVTIGAGLSKGQAVVVYQDLISGQLFHRDYEDFVNRMKKVGEPDSGR